MPRNPAAASVPAMDAAGEFARGLARVTRRGWIAGALTASGVAFVIVAIGIASGWTWSGVGLGVAAAAMILSRERRRRDASEAARAIERARPGCRNVVITAEELLRHPERAAPWMRARVLAAARALVEAESPSAAVPLARPIVMFIVLVSAGGLIVGASSRRGSDAARAVVSHLSRGGTASPSAPLKIVVKVTPPAYTGLSPREQTNPDRVEVLQGSRVSLVVTGPAAAWTIRFGTRPVTVTRSGEATTAAMTLSESGYFAIEPTEAPGGSPDRRLLPVAVTPDSAPIVRIDAPGRDLVLPGVRRPVPLRATASDDFGLQSFELRYTKVSGTGEQFEFEEGSLPLGVTRASEVAWKGSAEIAVGALGLEPGDALVYRVVARDRRPGESGLASSETFFIEIAGPGQVALEGFEMPPDRVRYALSQQMIVLKIQRLRARERTLGRAALEEATAAIASEQRAVRANFIFLMGGHVEDEEEEAERSSEIAEGRLQSPARKEINSAIDHMSRAEQGLTAVNTGAALPPARAAVEALQRAFGRSRYILRSVPVRSGIDPARRLTGELSAAADWRREVPPATLDRETRDARALLAKMLELASAIRAGARIDRGAFAALAEQALAIDPGAAPWTEVGRRLELAGEAAAGGRSPAAEISEAMAPVVALAQSGARLATEPGTRAPGALLRAWAEEARR
jgi:hypothetical protein